MRSKDVKRIAFDLVLGVEGLLRPSPEHRSLHGAKNIPEKFFPAPSSKLKIMACPNHLRKFGKFLG